MCNNVYMMILLNIYVEHPLLDAEFDNFISSNSRKHEYVTWDTD